MRFSVVIPTYERREIVLRNVQALERQTLRDFEVIVVVDGSTDGTTEALRSLELSFPLTVVEQPNCGQAEARNAGAAVARGDVLLFLDDDMEADPALLAEHDRSQRKGIDLVLGHVPLHPASPENLLSWGAGLWADARKERLTAPGAEVRTDDLITGQCSIARRVFEKLGGFDGSFTREGLFGGEDIDFGYRLLKAGYRVSFDPEAISYQFYDVDPAAYLERAYDAGRSEQELIVKHPEQGRGRWHGPRLRTRRSMLLLGPLVVAPRALSWPLRSGASALLRSGLRRRWLRNLFWGLRTVEHLRGVRDVRRTLSTGRAVVLAYHSIADLSDVPVLAEYGISPERFATQLTWLRRFGWRFVDLDAVLLGLRGEGRLPRRAVLVTFDDCYADLAEAASLLAERRIPAVAFAVAGYVGGTNDWDRGIGAGTVALLDADGLRALAGRGVEIGSHASTHRLMSRVPHDELEEELRGSAVKLQTLGLPRPRAFAYPHGDWTPEVAQAVAEAGYEVAFTVDPGVVERGAHRYALPRIEVLAGDGRLSLTVKLATASWPEPLRRRITKLVRAPAA
jgi:glycosyltransferase involved in cell wall biosynthesis/peptidoglycan/xylan/chitin deacetylase (PgdA/CDA1 family)